jgi:hypothetical protein
VSGENAVRADVQQQQRAGCDNRRLAPSVPLLSFPPSRKPDREAQTEQDPGVDDEQRVIVVPAVAERREQLNGVASLPIEQRVRDAADVAERQKLAEVHVRAAL